MRVIERVGLHADLVILARAGLGAVPLEARLVPNKKADPTVGLRCPKLLASRANARGGVQALAADYGRRASPTSLVPLIRPQRNPAQVSLSLRGIAKRYPM